MDITPLIPEGQHIISRYGNCKFVIGTEEYTSCILVLPQNVIALDEFTSKEDYQHLLEVLFEQKNAIEVLLCGVGEMVEALLPGFFSSQLKEWGIAVDIMNTGAACRTYNILLSEGRKVAAVLKPVQ